MSLKESLESTIASLAARSLSTVGAATGFMADAAFATGRALSEAERNAYTSAARILAEDYAGGMSGGGGVGAYFPEGTPAPPGGCDTFYRVSYTVTFTNNDGPQTDSRTFGSLPGPVGNLRLEPNPNGNGIQVIGIINGNDGATYSGYGTGNNPATNGTLSNVSITRRDGEPDNCNEADARPRYQGPITIINNNGDTINVEGDLVFNPPIAGPGGGLTIPFAWISPELNLNGNFKLDLDPEIELDFGDGDDRPLLPGEDGFPDSPDAPPPPPDNYAPIIGLFVVSTRTTGLQTTGEFGGGEFPTVFVPRCATVVFAIRGPTTTGWSAPINVQSLSQYVPWIGELEAYDFRIIPGLGFSAVGTAVRLKESNNN